MQRMRYVKPDLFHHEKLFEAEAKSQLPIRIAFVGLFGCCDKEGRFKWRAKELKSQILPYDDLDMNAVLKTLRQYGFVKCYRARGSQYGYIPSWRDHQPINGREMPSILPPPPGQPDHSTQQAPPSDLKAPAKGTHTPANPLSPSVETIFTHWKVTLNHLDAQFDNKRQKVIEQALQTGYSMNQLCDAITGCSLTPYNMGHNEQGQRYDSLELILRDAEHIDRFIHNKANPPHVQSRTERLEAQNEETLMAWMQQKTGKNQVYEGQAVDKSTFEEKIHGN
ncbi:MAG: hypothetical protein K0R24_1111 [Gammaproteobacteria bacterium]|nr:hypothetical protein [Gammaproteobacteria bacterium]